MRTGLDVAGKKLEIIVKDEGGAFDNSKRHA